ncbi:MAG TPA: LysR family transcriptional regulator [Candidatus Cybelea sp.]|nr:LysR family transcriptional regulator [Candidatus Cybelea sp.]
MHEKNLTAVDLNLLPVFEALIAERSVTRAAARLGLTQPAASHALARLRALLGDPLLVRAAGGMQPTPRALALAPKIAEVLFDVRGALGPAAVFEPARSRRRFVLAMSDYAAFTLGPALLSRLRAEAPGASLVIRHASRALGFAMLESGEAELIVGTFPHPPAWQHGETLAEDALVCAMRRGHPAARRRFDLPAYLAAEHLNVSLRGESSGNVDDTLASLGHRRRVVATVGHFLVAPSLVAASDLIATEPMRVMRPFAREFGLVLRPPPFAVPKFTLTQMWHRRMAEDDGHRWLRERVRDAAKTKPARAPVSSRTGAFPE